MSQSPSFVTSSVLTIECVEVPSPWAMYVGVLRSSRKSNVAVPALAKVVYVRPAVTLTAHDVAAYSVVCGYSAAQGVPLLYPQMLTFPLLMSYFASEHCPWPAMGTVHLANRVAQHCPIVVGDTLRVEMHVGLNPHPLQVHEKGQVFNIDFFIYRGDTLVWDATQTLLRIGVKSAVGGAYQSQVTFDNALSRQTDILATADIGRRYGKVSGDLNPIHLAAMSAKIFGFKRAIAHGMWTKARALAAVLPQHAVAQARVQVEFKTPLYLPAKASLWSTYPSTVSTDGQGSALFEVRNQAGDKPHLKASLTYVC